MSVGAALTSVQVFLADGGNSPADVDPTTGHGPEWGKAGPIGLLTIVLLCVAVYFLVKSMNRNIKKVPESFDPAPRVSVTAGGASSANAADGGSAAPAPAADAAGSPIDPNAGPPVGPGSQASGSNSAE